MLTLVVTMQGEITFWSLLANKGLKACQLKATTIVRSLQLD